MNKIIYVSQSTMSHKPLIKMVLANQANTEETNMKKIRLSFMIETLWLSWTIECKILTKYMISIL